MEYSFLLTSQLDTQRMYFEEKLLEAENQHSTSEKIAVVKVCILHIINFELYIIFFFKKIRLKYFKINLFLRFRVLNLVLKQKQLNVFCCEKNYQK